MLRAVSHAQRGRDRGAVSVRRWRRNRLRYAKKRSNRFWSAAAVLLAAVLVCDLFSNILTATIPVLSFHPFTKRETGAQTVLRAASRARR
ncbi:unnamed protein product, partial [Ectocarpus sp. 4 AP-2014]